MDTARFSQLARRLRATLATNLRWVVLAGLLLVAVGAVSLASTRGTVSRTVSSHASVPTATLNPAALAATATASAQAANEPPPGAKDEFTTDFSKHSVPYTEILSGGPPKDGIPAITAPKYVGVSDADGWLRPNEPVIFVQVGSDARAYPIQILIWHEITDTAVGGVPLAVTFCPLCNTAIAYERTVGGRVLTFGTTGRLRFSNLIMYDHETETWWQQADGTAIVGTQTGTQLTPRPAAIIAWSEFKGAHPDGQVLSRDTGYSRPYGRNPYPGYDDINSSPFLYSGPPIPGTLPALARILAIKLNGDAVAYPFSVLQQVHVVDDTVGGTDLVVFWAPGTSSPLDTQRIPNGQDVGSATAYARTLDGLRLTFAMEGVRIVDNETGSQWDPLGRAISGPLAGKQLTPVVATNSFWFAWAAFQPNTHIYHP